MHPISSDLVAAVEGADDREEAKIRHALIARNLDNQRLLCTVLFSGYDSECQPFMPVWRSSLFRHLNERSTSILARRAGKRMFINYGI